MIKRVTKKRSIKSPRSLMARNITWFMSREGDTFTNLKITIPIRLRFFDWVKQHTDWNDQQVISWLHDQCVAIDPTSHTVCVIFKDGVFSKIEITHLNYADIESSLLEEKNTKRVYYDGSIVD